MSVTSQKDKLTSSISPEENYGKKASRREKKTAEFPAFHSTEIQNNS